ncbi:MAG: glutaredoxin family protein [Pseudomonadales bacterium]
MESLWLLGTAGCHLCDALRPEAEAAARALGFHLEAVEVMDHEALLARFETQIPVLYWPRTDRALPGPFTVPQALAFLQAEA